MHANKNIIDFIAPRITKRFFIFGVVSVVFVGKAPAAKPKPAKQAGKAPAPAESDNESSEDDSDDDGEPQSKVAAVKGNFFC